MSSPQDPAQALFGAALELLARREHSRHELREKLARRFPDADFDALFERLLELNYQSDQRFAEAFARSRMQRGQGPMRIRRELQQRGVEPGIAGAAIDQLQVDWYHLAEETLQRKFRHPVDQALPREARMKELARRQRYLAYRGFPADAIQCALEADVLT